MGVIGAKKFNHWETQPVKVTSKLRSYFENFDNIFSEENNNMQCPKCKHWNRCPSCNGCFCERCGTELTRPEPGEEVGKAKSGQRGSP